MARWLLKARKIKDNPFTDQSCLYSTVTDVASHHFYHKESKASKSLVNSQWRESDGRADTRIRSWRLTSESVSVVLSQASMFSQHLYAKKALYHWPVSKVIACAYPPRVMVNLMCLFIHEILAAKRLLWPEASHPVLQYKSPRQRCDQTLLTPFNTNLSFGFQFNYLENWSDSAL